MNETAKQENKMGTMPITKLLLNMSLPIMFSMLVQAFYNIADSIFVARISEGALTAMSIAFPVQTLMISFGIGTAIGVNALLAMRLGQKDFNAVNKIAVNGFFLAVCTFVFFCIFCFFGLNAYVCSQTSDTQIIEFSNDYLNIILYGAIGLFLGIMSDRILQATGRTFFTMITQLVGAVTNIIFDPILIFGIGPFPELGMKGAAIATILGQILAFFLSVFFNMKYNKEIKFKFKNFKPDGLIIRQIYKIAIPAILMQSINSFTTYGMNMILKKFTDTAIAVYGVYFKLNSIFFMPLFGLTTGMIPIVSYNFGARNRQRIIKTIKTTLCIAVIIMLAGISVFELIPEELLRMFKASDNMMSMGKASLRIIAPSFIGAAIAITFSASFQAMGKAVYSMIISFIRQFVILLPVAYALSFTGDVNKVWLCFLIAEVFAIACSLYYMSRLNRKHLSKMN